MSCDILELEILDEYEQDVQMNLDFSGDILYLLDQSISKDTLTIKHIHLNNGENKDSVLENYINCMGTISGNGEFLQWYESYDAGEFMSVAGLILKAVQYITYFDGDLQGHRFRRLCVWNWVDDWVWSEWTLQDNSYITNLGTVYDISHLESLIKNDNTPYFFSAGAGLFSKVGKGPFIGTRYNNIISCTDITNGKIWEIDITLENQPKQINSIQIDQTYTPGSPNAQSGIAVAEALSNIKNVIDAGIFATEEDLKNYKFEVGKVYTFIMSGEFAAKGCGSGYCMGYITMTDGIAGNDIPQYARLHFINLTTGLSCTYKFISNSFVLSQSNFQYLGHFTTYELSNFLLEANELTFYNFTCEMWYTDDYYHPLLGTMLFNSDGENEWHIVDLFNGKRYRFNRKVGPISISEREISDIVANMSPFKPQNMYTVSYDSLFSGAFLNGMNGKVVQTRPQWGSFEGSTTGIDLPHGTYLAIRDLDYNVVSCWSLTDNTLYVVTRNESEVDGEIVVSYAVTSSKNGLVTKEELDAAIGDIETLLASI